MLTFAFMHYPYLVCILFGMSFLHLFTSLKSCVSVHFLMLISVTVRPKPKNILSVTTTPELETVLTVSSCSRHVIIMCNIAS